MTKSADRKPIHVVAGLIVRDGLLLACQRHESAAFPLKWEFPGGKVEFAENPVDALRRELKEELGIIVRRETEVFRHLHAYPQGPEVSLRFFRVWGYDGAVNNLVFQRIAWVRLSDLAHLDFLAGDRPLIDKLITDGGAAILG